MLNLEDELRQVVDALEAGGIPYAIAGGVAVSIYTTPRATEDIDLLISATDFDRTLKRLRGSPQDLADLEALGPEGQE